MCQAENRSVTFSETVNNPEEYARFVTENQVPREAMAMQDGFPKWNARICEFCGLCQTICPTDAITIRRRK